MNGAFLSLLGRSKKSQPKGDLWPIFISYRRGDITRKIALWLKRELESETIRATNGQVFQLRVFVDVAEPHQVDFQANLVPNLRHSRVMILLVDEAATFRKTQGAKDYLYEELDWWARRRKTPPIILQLDTQSAAKLVANSKYKGWSTVNFLDCPWGKWAAEPDGEESEREQLLRNVREGIRNKGLITHIEEVRRLRRQFRIAVLFAVAALVAAGIAVWQYQESVAAKDEAVTAKDEAVKATKAAEANLETANTARKAQTEELHKFSQSDVALSEPYFKQDDWRIGLAYLDRSLEANPQNVDAQNSLWLKLKTEPRLWHPLPNYRLMLPDKPREIVGFIGSDRVLLNLDDSTYELVEIPSGKVDWKKLLVRGKNSAPEDEIQPDLVLSKDGQRLAALSEDHSLQVMDVASGSPLWETKIAQDNRLNLVGFDPTNRYLLVNYSRSVMASLDIEAKKPLFEYDIRMENGQRVGDGGAAAEFLGFSPDGRFLLLQFAEDGGLVLYDFLNGKRIGPQTFSELNAEDGVVVFSPDSTSLAVCPSNGGIYGWKLSLTQEPGDPAHKDGTPTAGIWNAYSGRPTFLFSNVAIDDEQHVLQTVDDSQLPRYEFGNIRIGGSEDSRLLIPDTGRAVELSQSGKIISIRGNDGTRLARVINFGRDEPFIFLDGVDVPRELSADDTWAGCVDKEGGLCLWNIRVIPLPNLDLEAPKLRPPPLHGVDPWYHDLITVLGGFKLTADDKTEDDGLPARLEALKRLHALKLEGLNPDVSDPAWADLLKWWFTQQPLPAGASSPAVGSKHSNILAYYNPPIEFKPALPTGGTNHIANALAYRAHGDNDKAIAEYDLAIQSKDLDEIPCSNRGVAYQAEGAYANALADYTKVIQEDPSAAAYYYNCGVLRSAQGEYSKALADYNRAIQLDETFVKAYGNRSATYYDLGNYDYAVVDATQAIRLAPDYSPSYYERGIAYQAEGEFAKALADYDQVIQKDPKNALAYTGRARLLATCPVTDLRDANKAVEDATKACDLSGWNFPIAIDTLSIACAQAGDNANAEKWKNKFQEVSKAGGENIPIVKSNLSFPQTPAIDSEPNSPHASTIIVFQPISVVSTPAPTPSGPAAATGSNPFPAAQPPPTTPVVQPKSPLPTVAPEEVDPSTASSPDLAPPAAPASPSQHTQAPDQPVAPVTALAPDAEVSAFIQRYFHAGGSDSNEDESTYYANQVNYFDDGPQNLDYIRQDVAKYNGLHPTRSFVIQDDANIQDLSNGSYLVKCRVSVKRLDAASLYQGIVTDSILVKKIEGHWKIVSITSGQGAQ